MVLGDDYEVKRTTWESKVPVEFVLDDASAVTRRRDHSSFVMLPRISYFPLHLSKVLGRLLSNTQTNDDSGSEDVGSDAWLQFNGAPLKWHYPIGVLYDMFVNGNVDEQPPLPWLLTIKLKKFPDELIRCRSKEGMRNVFIQSVKEADHLKHRGSIVQSMTADEHSRLFNSILNDRFDDFWSVNKKLMVDDAHNKNTLLHIPIRFYETSLPFRQVLVTPRKKTHTASSSTDSEQQSLQEEEVDTVLRDALLKALFSPTYSDSTPPPDALSLVDGQLSEDVVAITHGIVIPLDTPVIWLATNLAYPDNFVHVVLRRRSTVDVNLV